MFDKRSNVLIYNLIVLFYDQAMDLFPGVDSHEFKKYVCDHIGMSDKEWKEIMEN